MSEPDVFVGIDVSKVQLDVALRPTDDRWPVSNDEPGIGLVVERLRTIQPALIVLEATGGLEVPVVGALAEAGLPVVVVKPRHARDFAKATGRLAKTAPREAPGLAHVTAAGRPTPRPLPEAQAHAWSALLTRRRLQSAPPRMRADSQAHIAWLEHRLARTDADLAVGSRASPRGCTPDEMLPSTPGVGPGLARTLVAEVPELGLLHRQASAARLGVAPFNDDRGTLRGQRVVWGGRAQVHAVLYMSTLSAVRHHPGLKACYERLRAAGKAATVALTAGMRKRLTILKAMIQQRTRWQAKTTETS